MRSRGIANSNNNNTPRSPFSEGLRELFIRAHRSISQIIQCDPESPEGQQTILNQLEGLRANIESFCSAHRSTTLALSHNTESQMQVSTANQDPQELRIEIDFVDLAFKGLKLLSDFLSENQEFQTFRENMGK